MLPQCLPRLSSRFVNNRWVLHVCQFVFELCWLEHILQTGPARPAGFESAAKPPEARAKEVPKMKRSIDQVDGGFESVAKPPEAQAKEEPSKTAKEEPAETPEADAPGQEPFEFFDDSQDKSLELVANDTRDFGLELVVDPLPVRKLPASVPSFSNLTDEDLARISRNACRALSCANPYAHLQ